MVVNILVYTIHSDLASSCIDAYVSDLKDAVALTT